MKVKKAISKVALKNGVSENEVRAEIQKVIDKCMKNNDPKTMELWKKIPRKGKKLTPEEFIDYMAESVRRKL